MIHDCVVFRIKERLQQKMQKINGKKALYSPCNRQVYENASLSRRVSSNSDDIDFGGKVPSARQCHTSQSLRGQFRYCLFNRKLVKGCFLDRIFKRHLHFSRTVAYTYTKKGMENRRETNPLYKPDPT
jgi:hypothetical protein